MTDHDSGYEAAVNALGLLTATHHDGTLSGPTTMAYLAEVAPDRRDAVRLAAGLTALAKMLIALRAEAAWRDTQTDPRRAQSVHPRVLNAI